MGMNWWISHRRGFTTEDAVPFRDLTALAINAFQALLIPAILLYGIYGGVTTPTEAAAVAAPYALILAAVFYRALSLRASYRILLESARSSAAVGLFIGGALILNYIVAAENFPGLVANSLVGIDLSLVAFLVGVKVLIHLLGCILDASTIILVIIPLFLPACRELGVYLVHFVVIALVNCMIGQITSPYGILLSSTTRSQGVHSMRSSGKSSLFWRSSFSLFSRWSSVPGSFSCFRACSVTRGKQPSEGRGTSARGLLVQGSFNPDRCPEVWGASPGALYPAIP